MRRVAALTSCLLLGLATPVLAQSSDQLEIAVSANVRKPDAVPSLASQTRTQAGFSGEVARVRPGGVGWVVDVSVARGALLINDPPGAESSQGVRHATFVDITGGVRVSFATRVRPFFQLLGGASIGRVTYTGTVFDHSRSAIGQEGTRLLFRPSAGIDWFLGSRVGVRAQATGMLMSTNTLVRWPAQFNIGVVVRMSSD
jgi:hypothetical protein